MISHTVAMNAWQSARRWSQALSVHEELPRRRFKPDVLTYVAGMARQDAWSSAASLLRSLRLKHLESELGQGMAMGHLARDGHWLMSLELLQASSARHLEVASMQVLNACQQADSVCGGCRPCQAAAWAAALATSPEALAACGAAQQWRRALQLLRQRLATGVQPDVVASTAAAAAVPSRHWRRGVALLADAHAMRIAMDEAHRGPGSHLKSIEDMTFLILFGANLVVLSADSWPEELPTGLQGPAEQPAMPRSLGGLRRHLPP